jgi:UDP:flavonoid glycosyltransferase YjiC (YdhE family)
VRVAIAALGTRGDVAPYVVLGRGLRAAGHDVLISTMERFRGLVEGASLGFHALPGDPADAFHRGRIDVSPSRPLHHVNVLHAAVDALVSQTDPEPLRQRWADRDSIIFSSSTTFAHFVAAGIGARSAMVVMTPAVATGAFPHAVLMPGLALGPRGNLASWLMVERLANAWFKEPLKPGARRAWGLPPFALSTDRRGAGWPPFAVVHAYSPAVVARPADWPGHVSVTGWLLPEPSSDPLPEHVERFLAQGEPPVYVGFGSMPVPHPEATARMLVAALQRTGQRAIVCGAGLADASALRDSDAVLAADELPHERLLPRVKAVVHHGGSGTVGAGLRAGKPTLVTPFIFDQFFWGRRVRKLGAGPAPIPFGRLSEDRLTRALAQLTSGRYDTAAQDLGHHIQAEDPAALAVHHLEQLSDLA